jgi:phospholipid transport system transporter-binding protein
VLTLPDELTHVQATACLAGLVPNLAAEAVPVRVDASALRHFDSSALAVLLELRRACAVLNKPMVVQGLPGGLRDLAALYGVEGLLPST